MKVRDHIGAMVGVTVKSPWRKVILYVGGKDWADFDTFAWDAADRLWQVEQAPMYYARYSDLAGNERVEIQVKTDWTPGQFQSFFEDMDVNRIEVKACEGSPAHAAAYLLARELKGKGEPLMKDVMHWTFNMAGYSYMQEIRLLGEEVAAMAANLEQVGPI